MKQPNIESNSHNEMITQHDLGLINDVPDEEFKKIPGIDEKLGVIHTEVENSAKGNEKIIEGFKNSIEIPQEVIASLSDQGLQYDITGLTDNMSNYVVKQLRLPRGSRLSDENYKALLQQTSKKISKEIHNLPKLIEKIKEDNNHLSIPEQRWIINSHINESLSTTMHSAIAHPQILIKNSSQAGYENLVEISKDTNFDFSLLNEKDKETESIAMVGYLCSVGLQCIPGAGSLLSLGVDSADILSNTDATLALVKKVLPIDKEYNIEKTVIDNTLAGAGIVLTPLGLQGLTKSKKLANALNGIKHLSMSRIGKIVNMFIKNANLGPVGDKLKDLLGLSQPKKIKIESVRKQNINEINANYTLDDISWNNQMNKELGDAGITSNPKLLTALKKIHKTGDKFKSEATKLYPKKFTETGALKKGETITDQELNKIYSSQGVKLEAGKKILNGRKVLQDAGVNNKIADKFITNQMEKGMLLDLNISKGYQKFSKLIREHTTVDKFTFKKNAKGEITNEEKLSRMITQQQRQQEQKEIIINAIKILDDKGGNVIEQSNVIKQLEKNGIHSLDINNRNLFNEKGFFNHTEVSKELTQQLKRMNSINLNNKVDSVFQDIIGRVDLTTFHQTGKMDTDTQNKIKKLERIVDDKQLDKETKTKFLEQIKSKIGIDISKINQNKTLEDLVAEKSDLIVQSSRKLEVEASGINEAIANKVIGKEFGEVANNDFTIQGKRINADDFNEHVFDNFEELNDIRIAGENIENLKKIADSFIKEKKIKGVTSENFLKGLLGL